MKILIPLKKEAPNLISTLFEEFLLDGSRKRSQQQVISFSKFLIEQSGKLREDSKPTEEESLQLENLRNTLNSQWKEQRDLIGERELYVCYAKIGLLFVLTFCCLFDTSAFQKILAVKCTWHPLVFIPEILVSLAVLNRLLKRRRQIIAESQSDVENGTEKRIGSETMELSYTDQLEKCVDFYSKEVFPLKEKVKALSNHVSFWVIICLSIFLLNAWTLIFYGIIETLKLLNSEFLFTFYILPSTIAYTAFGFGFVVWFLRENEVAM